MSTTTQQATDRRTEQTLRAVVRTESGSTYRLDGDRVVLDGPGDEPFQEFTLVSLDGSRLMYTDGEQLFRSSEIVALSSV
ncbi:hypothetical protein [Euzebya rosea]|uniref:hypothetical protein n=1 Tax=Euzebya rosea TaxID=2052804 RepID=UPI000D3E7131|nr:hypothetical protein [Euzebya rosea]